MKRKEGLILTLQITSEQGSAPGTERHKTFGPEGGTIGRLAGNHWVLADDYVSNRHARIRFEDGAFSIEDTSTNGVYINDRRLEKGRPSPVASGDRLFIEPFEIVATISESPDRVADEPAGGIDPFARDDPGGLSRADPWRPTPVPLSATPDVVPEPAAGDDVDWLNALGPAPAELPRHHGRIGPSPSRGGDLLKEHYSPPAIVTPPSVRKASSGALIPEDYDPTCDNPTVGDRVPAKPIVERRKGDRRRSRERRADGRLPVSPPPAVRPDPPGSQGIGQSGGGSDLAAVLAGAGLQGLPVTPEVARQFGQILRVVVAGVLDVLQARQQTKGEFGIRHTVIQPRRNNPLKHSVDVEDALHNLLIKRNPGYLGPVESFEDAFNDLRHHQLAMLSGVRVAFEAMFGQFDPERLQKEFDRRTPRPRKGALAALQGKPDYWELYREWVQRMAQDADGSFRALFGQEFAKAYEDQLDRLKAPANAGGSGPRKGALE